MPVARPAPTAARVTPQPRPVRTLHNGNGWDHDSLAAMVEPALRADLYGLEDSAAVYNWDPI